MAAGPHEKPPAVLEGDRDVPVRQDVIPVTVVLDRLRSAFNVGNIFRIAEALRVECIVTGGYTASPPHEKLAKTARGCERLVPVRVAPVTADAVRQLKSDGYTVYGVETAEKAFCCWDADYRFPAAFVLGNEAVGLSEDVRNSGILPS